MEANQNNQVKVEKVSADIATSEAKEVKNEAGKSLISRINSAYGGSSNKVQPYTDSVTDSSF